MSNVTGGVDLFMSYSTRHSEIVQDVALRLQQRGVNAYIDIKDQEMPGQRFLEVLENMLRRASAVAVFIGAGGVGQFQRLEVTAAIVLSAKRGLRVVPILLPDVGDLAELDLFLQCFSWIDFRHGISDADIDKLARVCTERAQVVAAIPVGDVDHSLPALLKRAQKRLIISGHTLDKFTRDESVRQTLIGLAVNGRSISILQLNPNSAYAAAHRPFHELESTSASVYQYEHTLQCFLDILKILGPHKRDSLDVTFSNYMPRFRTVIVDETVYVYFYMYGGDVSDSPDLCLEPRSDATDVVRRRILYSTLSTIYAPESMPFIRSGQVFSYWKDTDISKWASWTSAERLHHKLTHEFYVVHARVFHARYGRQLEADVRKHLDCDAGIHIGPGLRFREGSRIPSAEQTS